MVIGRHFAEDCRCVGIGGGGSCWSFVVVSLVPISFAMIDLVHGVEAP